MSFSSWLHELLHGKTVVAPAPRRPLPTPTPLDPLPVLGVERFFDSKGRFLINRPGLELTKHFESGDESTWEKYLTAYLDDVGVATIGFGHIKGVTGYDVMNKRKISMKEAERLLMLDLEEEAAVYVRAYLKYEDRLNDAQFSALVDLTFNRGAGRLNDQMDDVVDAALEDGTLSGDDFTKISTRLMYYNFAVTGGKNKILSGLTRRRAANRAMFRGEDWTKFKEADWKKYL